MKKLDRAKMEQFERTLSTISSDVKALKDKRERSMIEMRFVGIAFDPNKYKDGESQVNKALGEGSSMPGASDSLAALKAKMKIA